MGVRGFVGQTYRGRERAGSVVLIFVQLGWLALGIKYHKLLMVWAGPDAMVWHGEWYQSH